MKRLLIPPFPFLTLLLLSTQEKRRRVYRLRDVRCLPKERFAGKSLLLAVLICFIGMAGAAQAQLRFKPLAPCRIADTRNANGPFGGPAIGALSSRSFAIPNSPCLAGVPATVAAYSLNVTAIPAASSLGYLTIWPTGQSQPLVSTLNSYDGRVKANAAIVPAGTGGAVSVYATDITHVVLDINGYFLPANDSSAPLAFFSLTPCRLVDTRNSSGPLGGPSLPAQQARSFPVQSGACNIPPTAQAYSLNFTAVPHGPLGYLTTWPTGMSQPLVSTLNALTGTVTANAAIVPAGNNGAISVYVKDASDVVIDINGYFAPSNTGTDSSLYTVAPCRVVDTRGTTGMFSGPIRKDMTASPCWVPPSAQAVVLNATVVPGTSSLGNLTLWPDGQTQPYVSTLNAWDGLVTSNMAIVPTSSSGVIYAYATDPTHLILDTSGYFLSGTGIPPTMYTLTVVPSGYGAGTVTSLDGKISCGAVCAVTYMSGTTVTLNPAAAAGSSFVGWSGGGCSGTGSCTVAVNSALSVAAIFSSSSSLSGNWEFNTASTAVPGVTSEVQGSMVQAGTTVSGVLHVLGSSCFDSMTNVTMTGTISGTFVTVSSAAVAGQVVTFSGTVTNAILNGTYTITGGCAGGDRGSVTGFRVPSLTGNWAGSFSASPASISVTSFLIQGSAFADGSSALNGTVAFQGSPCFAWGTVTGGAITSPTGSSVIGTFVYTEINTSNGLVVFEGFVNQSGNQIPGIYFVVGGSCDGNNGTATVNKM